MSPDDRTVLLEKLPHSASEEVLKLLTPAERAVAVSLLEYPEHSVGRLMTPDYVSVREHWSVQQVLDYIRTDGHAVKRSTTSTWWMRRQLSLTTFGCGSSY